MIYQLESQGRIRLGGSVYSPNELGLLISISLWSTYYLYGIKKINKKQFFLTIGLMIFIIFLTGSRTSLAIFLISLLYLVYQKNSIIKLFFILLMMLSFIVIPMFFSLADLGQGKDPLEELYTLNNRIYIYGCI